MARSRSARILPLAVIAIAGCASLSGARAPAAADLERFSGDWVLDRYELTDDGKLLFERTAGFGTSAADGAVRMVYRRSSDAPH